MLRIPPPSIRQPPSVVLAVFVFELFASTSVPGPSFVIVAEPAMVEEIVPVTPASVVIFAGVGPSVSVDPAIVYPFVLNVSDVADCGELSMTVPADPVKTASAADDQEILDETPSNHPPAASQFPEPPSPAPVEMLFPEAMPSASQ
jgi:hypothetical protein